MLFSIMLLCLMASGQAPALGQNAAVSDGDIVILYENDVHGAVEGYPLMAAMRDEMRQKTPYVSVVSCGDFLSGTSLGSVSHGRYIVRMMNAVGYDYVTLGNHEFDFGIDTMNLRMSQLTATTLCCNYSDLRDGSSRFKGYEIRQYGSVSVAFVGLTTPHVPTSSTPIYFQDSTGNWLYTFYAQQLELVLQKAVDDARSHGADYVVVLSHVGEVDLPGIVEATRGIDVVLDGHSHSVIPQSILYNRDAQEVLWTSTGSRFKYIGRLVITPQGKMWSELLPTSQMTLPLTAVADTLRAIRQEYAAVGQREVGRSDVQLWRKGREGDYVDSPLGNFFSDAFRALTHAEVGLANAGGIRCDIDKGQLVFDDIFSAAPFDNRLCLVEMSGEALMDALEMGCRRWPKIGGGFLHVSGLMYTIDTTVRSTVVCDENDVFMRVGSDRMVKNVRVWDAEKQQYLPLDSQRIYRVAGCDYTLLQQGDGHVFRGIKVTRQNICSDVEALEVYLRDCLNGVVGDRYAHTQGRIKVN